MSELDDWDDSPTPPDEPDTDWFEGSTPTRPHRGTHHRLVPLLPSPYQGSFRARHGSQHHSSDNEVETGHELEAVPPERSTSASSDPMTESTGLLNALLGLTCVALCTVLIHFAIADAGAPARWIISLIGILLIVGVFVTAVMMERRRASAGSSRRRLYPLLGIVVASGVWAVTSLAVAYVG